MSPIVEENEVRWPSAAFLVVCLAMVAAGYLMGLLRGPAPKLEVQVKMIEPSETTAH